MCDDNVTLTIVEVLDKLNKREVTGHAALSLVNGFIKANEKYADLIYNIIDRNLKTRIDAKMINKVFPALIPVFEVALAGEYEKKKKFVNFDKQKWFASRKLDGCRCLVIKNAFSIKAMSRQGKEFFTLDNLLKNFNLPDGVYDGEICIVDEYGDEFFQGIMKEIRKKDHTIAKPRFKIFDYLYLDEFYSGESKRTFAERQKELCFAYSVVANHNKASFTNTFIDIVDQIPIRNEAHFEELKTEAAEKGWEGLIIREDWVYEGKRSRHMLKVKAFHDGEFKVISTYSTKKRMLIDGIEREMDCMGGVTINYYPDLEDGAQLEGPNSGKQYFNVDCGSGWSDAERLQFYSNPEEIIGKIITVQWFESTKNQDGGQSLRFPTKKWIHGKERDT